MGVLVACLWCAWGTNPNPYLTPAHLDGERNVRLRIAARALEGIGNPHVVQRLGQGGGLFGGGGCGRGLHRDSEARSVSQAVYCIGTAGCRLWSRGGKCATTVVVLTRDRRRCSYIPIHPILQQASRGCGHKPFSSNHAARNHICSAHHLGQPRLPRAGRAAASCRAADSRRAPRPQCSIGHHLHWPCTAHRQRR